MKTPIEILDEMIEETNNHYDKFPPNSEYAKWWKDSVIPQLEKAKERIKKETWFIPVSEQYPEDNTMVLGYIDFIVWVNLWWATESWEWIWDWEIQYTHWMPLPTPPNN